MSRGSIGLDDRLNRYLADNHPPEHPVLAELRKLTGKMPNSAMQIAPEQGHFLAFLVKLIGAKNTLEIGTFTGYSALAVALALPKDGHLIACDVSEAWTSIGRQHWEKAGVAAKIELRLGPALDSLKDLKREGRRGSFDFAFIDAAKSEYDEYYERTLPLVRKGGVIAFDNMLWGGAVADRKVKDADTRGIRALNAKIAGDSRVDSVLLPVGDGMMVARRVR
jgi:predicted O-methyltransferase YrrM